LASWKPDYSRAQLPTLDESKLAEANGIYGTTISPATLNGFMIAFGIPNSRGGAALYAADAGKPVNWNQDSLDPTYETVNLDVNNQGATSGCPGTGTMLAGYNDWANLQY